MPRRALPGASPFAGDDGAPDPGLAAALAAHAGSAVGPAPGAAGTTSTLQGVVAALASARVLVPVLARVEAEVTGADGLRVDKEASAGVVAVRAPDGRTALPVFSGVAAMTAWRTDARPVAAQAARAAASAVQEGWDLLLLDPAGPVTVVVPRPAVRSLAVGRTWAPAVRDDRVDAEVRTAVAHALSSVSALRGTDVVPGRRAEVAVVLGLRPGLDRTALDAVLAAVGDLLAADEVVTDRVDSLELRPVAAA